jgi:hypothetical protein
MGGLKEDIKHEPTMVVDSTSLPTIGW